MCVTPLKVRFATGETTDISHEVEIDLELPWRIPVRTTWTFRVMGKTGKILVGTDLLRTLGYLEGSRVSIDTAREEEEDPLDFMPHESKYLCAVETTDDMGFEGVKVPESDIQKDVTGNDRTLQGRVQPVAAQRGRKDATHVCRAGG